jgi:hypothetical protein
MKTRIKKFGVGNSPRILKLAENSSVDVTEFPLDQSATELFARITPKNCHSETDTGTPVGNEVW